MPRGKGPGGPRTGTVGERYPNRSDLAQARPLPVVNIPGQTYGDESAQAALQRATPMGGTPVATAPGTPGPGGAPAPSGLTQGTFGAPAGTVPFLHPTARPNEPVTAGLPTGPGPGPEALGALQPGQQTLAGLLQNMAASPNAPDAVKALASFTAAGRQ